jgi:hypothetical protein
MIGKLLKDECPEVKIKLSKLIVLISKQPVICKLIGNHSKTIINSLCENLKHNRNLIRKETIIALGEILRTDNAGKFFEECTNSLKIFIHDKYPEVRKCFYQIIFNLITSFNIIFLRKYEHNLVIYLINGLSDSSEEIRQMCFTLLEEAGNYRKKLAIELNEEPVNDVEMNGNTTI